MRRRGAHRLLDRHTDTPGDDVRRGSADQRGGVARNAAPGKAAHGKCAGCSVRGNGLVYRLDEVQYTSDPYHAFIAEPGAMLGNRMAAWLDREGPFKTVTQPGSVTPAQYVLEATVTELYGDFREGRRPAAVMAVQFVLIDEAGASPKVVHERTIASRVDLSQASPDALVRGYGKALAEILSQLVPELSAENVK